MKVATVYLQFAAILAVALAAGGYAGASVPGASDPQDLDKRAAKKAKNFSFKDLYSMQTKFLDSFLSPNNSIQVSSPYSRTKCPGIGL